MYAIAPPSEHTGQQSAGVAQARGHVYVCSRREQPRAPVERNYPAPKFLYTSNKVFLICGRGYRI